MSIAKDYLAQHVQRIDAQLASLQQQAEQRAQEAARLNALHAELSAERNSAAAALESLPAKPSRRK